MAMIPCATAVLGVGGLSDTSTIRTRPCVSICVKEDICYSPKSLLLSSLNPWHGNSDHDDMTSFFSHILKREDFGIFLKFDHPIYENDTSPFGKGGSRGIF
jgi:hypothetical protein